MKKIIIAMAMFLTLSQINAQDENIKIGLAGPIYGIKLNMNFPNYTGGWSRGYSIADQSGNNFISFGARGNSKNGIANNFSYGYIGKDLNDMYMVFKPDGNIGIGTASPLSKLQIMNDNDGLSFDANDSWIGIGFNRSVKNGQIFDSSKSGWQFTARDGRFSLEGYNGASSNLLNVLKNGNVGIGLTVPKAKLDIRGTSAVWSDFKNYSGTTPNNTSPNGKKPTLILNETPSGTYIPRTGGQVTYRGGLSFGVGGPGIYSINPNPAGSSYYGDLRFHTTAWNSSTKSYFNADRMVIKLNGNVGIGTSSPSEKLEIYNSNTTPGTLSLRSSRNDASFVDVGRIAAKQGKIEVSRIGMPRAGETNTGYLTFWTKETNESSLKESMRINSKGNVGIGTTTTGSHRLAVEGSIGAREVKVEATGWSDFVFENDYNLPTLREVEKHIKQKGHLKDIPSAKEVEKNGFFLGEMDAKLLQKIEELTLYTIQQEKKLEKQNKEIEELKTLVKKLINSKK